MLERIARGLGDVVFPPSCVHCRAIVEVAGEGTAKGNGAEEDVKGEGGEGRGGKGEETMRESGKGFRHLCAACVAEIGFVKAPHCTTCGSPFYGEMVGTRMCPHCEGLDPAYREGRTAALFKGPVRALIIELKYHRGVHVLADLAEIFRRAPHVLELARDATLVPVPLHPRKLRHRGYNQALLLSRELAAVAGGATRVEELLRRTAYSESQTGFDRRTRLANLKNAFALARGAHLNPDHHYLLIDDVFTTGSTLNSCALALRRAGALKLDVITLGHG